MTASPLARSIIALSLFAALAAPAFARDNGAAGATVTKEGLEGDGYTCSVVSTGFWECTKPGGTTYWCDAGSCQPKPFRVKPKKFGNVFSGSQGTLRMGN
jgi:hypothetical protein